MSLDAALRRICDLARTHQPERFDDVAREIHELASAPLKQAFSPDEQIRHLAEATEHLLAQHDCDHHGYETWDAALKAARCADSMPVG